MSAINSPRAGLLGLVVCALAASSGVDAQATPPRAPVPVIAPGRLPVPHTVAPLPPQTRIDVLRRLLPGVPGSGGGRTAMSATISTTTPPTHLAVDQPNPAGVGFLNLIGPVVVESEVVAPWRAMAAMPYAGTVTLAPFPGWEAGAVAIEVMASGSTTYMLDCAIDAYKPGDVIAFRANGGLTYPTGTLVPLTPAGSGHYLAPIVTAYGAQSWSGVILTKNPAATAADYWGFYGCDVHKVE
jgi:hypothetical protein